MISPEKGRQTKRSDVILYVFDLWTIRWFFFHAAEKCSKSKINSTSSPAPAVISKKWTHPIPFAEESPEVKMSMILKWVCGSGSNGDILSGNKKLTNITALLNSMKFNGYLRLFEIDMNPVMDLMTDSSKILYEDFKNSHKEDAWKCPICSAFFVQNCTKWKCCRCLFRYHERCTKERTVTREAGPGFSLCDSCFFML